MFEPYDTMATICGHHISISGGPYSRFACAGFNFKYSFCHCLTPCPLSAKRLSSQKVLLDVQEVEVVLGGVCNADPPVMSTAVLNITLLPPLSAHFLGLDFPSFGTSNSELPRYKKTQDLLVLSRSVTWVMQDVLNQERH